MSMIWGQYDNRKAPFDGWRPGRDSSFRIWISWVDGPNPTTTFGSLDWKGSKSPIRDSQIGLEKCEKLLKKHDARIEIALLYSVADNELIGEWKNNQWVKHPWR